MIDFEALERAFAPIQDVGRQEIPFVVRDQSVVLGPLLPFEETAAQDYAREWVKERTDEKGEVAKHIATEYMNILRVEILCYAIIEVNGLDLRGVDYVATGQQTEKGRPVRVHRHVAIRDLITKKRPWTRTMLEVAFDKYGELLGRIELEAADFVKYEPADLTTEYEKAKQRVTDIEEEMTKRAKGDPNLFAEQVEAIRQYDTANQTARRGLPEPQQPQEPVQETQSGRAPGPEVTPLETHLDPPEAPEAPEVDPVLEPETEWAEFDKIPSPADLRDNPPPPAPEPVGPVKSLRPEPRQPITPPTSSPPTGGAPVMGPPIPPAVNPLDGVMDSFDDPEDPGVMQAEQQRILAARKRMAEEREAARSNQGGSMVRRPPHARGAREEDAVSLDATHIGNVGDAPAFRLPTQELSARGRVAGRADPADASDSEAASRNPHFVPAKR